MCSNYRPVTRRDRLAAFFSATQDLGALPDFSAEIWPLGVAPFVHATPGSAEARQVDGGQFGLLPFWAKDNAYGKRTYNARSETVAKLPSFRDAWRHGQRCIVPAEAIYEPCYESGKAVRWRIGQAGDIPMGIAGIWAKHPSFTSEKEGAPLLSFAMLTMNADGHPVFQRMHGPNDEKRMVVILHPEAYERWLTCPVPEAASFFRQWPGALDASAQALPPRKPRAAATGGANPEPQP